MLALILLIVILGILIFVHEFGHFITAKKCGAHVYEFSLGMGPKVFGWKRKNDPTDYSIRLLPIGGYCAIAGEDGEDDGNDTKLKKDEYLCNKTKLEQGLVLIAGVCMNFITGFVILFISGLIFGALPTQSTIGSIAKGYPAEEAGMEVGDKITSVNGKHVGTWDKLTIELNIKQKNKTYVFGVTKKNGDKVTYKIKPKYDKKLERSVFGFGQTTKKEYGLLAALKYAFTKFGSIIYSMWAIIFYLITGKLSLSALSGPIGVYTVVGQAAKVGVESVLYIMAYLSINLGFVNILPFPALDGGRVLLLIIEAIRKKKMNPKVEEAINTVGFILLMILMVVISIKDVKNLIIK